MRWNGVYPNGIKCNGMQRKIRIRNELHIGLPTEFSNFIYKWIIGIVILLAITASIQSYLLPKKGVEHNDILYFEYNNYMIFKYSFFHLIDNTNLYVDYPEECYDLFKYTPSFALFMGLFAFLPDILGLILWNLLNALVLVSAIRYLPFDNGKKNMLLGTIS